MIRSSYIRHLIMLEKCFPKAAVIIKWLHDKRSEVEIWPNWANNPAQPLDHFKPLVISVMCWDDVLSCEAGRDLGLDGAVCGQASQKGKCGPE